MLRSQRPPAYGDDWSRGPLSTASQRKRSSSVAGPRCRTASLGEERRSDISFVRRLSGLEGELGLLPLPDAREEVRLMV